MLFLYSQSAYFCVFSFSYNFFVFFLSFFLSFIYLVRFFCFSFVFVFLCTSYALLDVYLLSLLISFCYLQIKHEDEEFLQWKLLILLWIDNEWLEIDFKKYLNYFKWGDFLLILNLFGSSVCLMGVFREKKIKNQN